VEAGSDGVDGVADAVVRERAAGVVAEGADGTPLAVAEGLVVRVADRGAGIVMVVGVALDDPTVASGSGFHGGVRLAMGVEARVRGVAVDCAVTGVSHGNSPGAEQASSDKTRVTMGAIFFRRCGGVLLDPRPFRK
jgi:hypothetical protein